MCCSCEEEFYLNCSCSLFVIKCISSSCCWCCFLVDWEKQLGDMNPFNILLVEVYTLLKKQKHLKSLKKNFDKLLTKMLEYQRHYTKLEKVNIHSYLEDASADKDVIFNRVEENLIFKIRYKISQWELMVEISLILLDLKTDYFEITSYKNIQKLTKLINYGIYKIAELLTTITKTKWNLNLYNSNKEKILDLETSLSLLELKLARLYQENSI